jgi:uncharacterized protein
MTNAASPFEPFIRQNTVLLTTYKRDGTPVGTAVHIAVDEGGARAFVRTYDAAWKTKRLRNNPGVVIAPSTFRGKPTGQDLHARATLLTGEEADRAARALARKYPFLHGFLIPFLHRRRHYRTMHYALTVAGE